MIILSNDYLSNVPDSKKISFGGPAIFAKNFSNYLNNLGHKWVGIVFEGKKNQKTAIKKLKAGGKDKFYWKLSLPTFLFKRITHAKKPARPEIILQDAIKCLKDVIKTIDPDLVFLNGFSLFVWVLMKAAYELGIPVVIEHAGILKKELEIYSDLFTPAGKQILFRMEKEIVNCSRHQIFLNYWSLNIYRQEISEINNKNVSVVPLPYFENWAVAAKPKRKKTKNLHIGVVARWDRIKNHQAVLALAKSIKRQGLPWRIHSITSIPATKYNTKFKDEYKKFIIVESQRNAKDLKNFFHQMDLIIVPSHFDVSPHVVLEAILLGTKTLISPNTGWVEEFKKAGANDLIIDFSKPKKTIERIKQVINKPIPVALFNSFKENHNPNNIFAQYLNIFKRIKI